MTPRYIAGALLTVAFIVYGSLTPFHFFSGGPGNPVVDLLAHWHTPDQSASGFVGNVALYMPLGLFIALALEPHGRPWVQALWAGLASLALCVCMELTQFYVRSRVTTLTDVYLNIAGGLLGALIVIQLPRRWVRPVGDWRQPAVLILLAAFAVVELYPFVPTLNTDWWIDALASLWRHPHMTCLTLARSLGQWLLAAALIGHLMGPRRSGSVLLAVMLVVFSGQIVMLGISLSDARWLGALIAAVLWWLLASRSPGFRFAVPALILVLVLLAEALTAHRGAAATWLPLLDLRHHSWPATLHESIVRLYPVAGLIWLAGRLGHDQRLAGLALATLLLIADVLSALIGVGPHSTTSAALALIAGAVIWWLPEQPAPRR